MPTKNKTIKNYDNTTIGRYIRAVENPDSAGFDRNRRVWFNPREDKSKRNRFSYDANSRGMGVDIEHNIAAKNYTNGIKGKELTEEEERYFRNLHIQESLDALKRQASKRGIPYPNNAFLEAMAVGAIYRGDAEELWNKNTPMGKAIRETGDDAEWKFSQAIDQFYKGKNMQERPINSEKFLDNGTLQTQVVPEYKIVEPSKIKSYGGSLSQHKQWNDLSMAEKSEMMKVAVKNGITTLPEIRDAYNELACGGNLYSGKESHSSQMNQGYVYDVLPRMLREAGLDVKVTSGYRQAGAAGKAGDKSWHTKHGAVDIKPQGKTTFEDIENALYTHPEISRYMRENGYGLLDESGRTQASKDLMHRTGATGAHFHIGKDTNAVSNYNARLDSMWHNNMAALNQQINNPFTGFVPSNPQAFFAPLSSYERPVIEQTEGPIVDEALARYSQAALDAEERRDKLNKLSFLLSMTSLSGQEGNPMLDTIGILSGNI